VLGADGGILKLVVGNDAELWSALFLFVRPITHLLARYFGGRFGVGRFYVHSQKADSNAGQFVLAAFGLQFEAQSLVFQLQLGLRAVLSQSKTRSQDPACAKDGQSTRRQQPAPLTAKRPS
jgi:hypothetical protein